MEFVKILNIFKESHCFVLYWMCCDSLCSSSPSVFPVCNYLQSLYILNESISLVLQNPDSLDSSIQSALATLFPPFEATAPVVLSQLFRTIEERYHGDALQCMLDFLIPSKHLMESVQQAACVSITSG